MPQVERYAKYVTTVDVDAPVGEVADRMRLEGVGSVVVVSGDRQPVGLITDRDLTLRVIAEGRDPEELRAGAVMSQPLIEVDATASLEHVIEVMREHHVRRVPVVQEKQVIGLVALDDLLVRLAREIDDVAATARGEFRDAQRAARLQEVRREVEDGVREMIGHVERIGDRALEGTVRELEGMIGRVRRFFD
jgi:signal-transduction protein with cAMP-binding, CBS, and nucleotidyltransferase domain